MRPRRRSKPTCANFATFDPSGASVKETSYYPALSNLFNEIGKRLKPRVRCIINLANRGAGIPDGGLFTPDQFQKPSEAEPLPGQLPARGVIEVKSTRDDAWVSADGEQVSRYWGKYRQVLVTNYRDFVLVGQDAEGKFAKLESFHLADSERAFWAAAAHPTSLAKKIEAQFEEYLLRVMRHAAQLAAPEDVAWFLASYARDGRARLEGVELAALATVRTALEEALGLKFEGEKGEHFFRSSLVQTLFYGVFSAWVLWSKQLSGRSAGFQPAQEQGQQDAGATARFDWYTTARYLRVPMISKLFQLVANPRELDTLQLTEVLDWAAMVLNRVDRPSFFDKFQESHAVQYFYEPFLEAFDPELRKELGVWYTPPEIVKYMVERVDTVLREELNLPDGLANKNVYVLDPCCGTGSYLVEVLDRIHRTLKERGEDALTASDLKEAAQKRVFGFEILPAPFVVSHLQLGLLLQNLGAPLDVAPGLSPARAALKGGATHAPERVGVYLTNALTGWEPPKGPKAKLLFPELEEERDAAEHVKREVPILVILGNPPYNSFAGISKMEEERDLSEAYRTTKEAPAPQGQGLNDLYVRFFRMAERRIAQKTGRGVVCLISNYSWLDGLSFTGMRERYLEAFDRIWIDCLNGDKYKTGKLTPEGEPDPSAFSTEFNREGIQVGTAISLLVVGAVREPPLRVRFRHLWGKTKRQQLLDTAFQDGESIYQKLTPLLEIGLPFAPSRVTTGYLQWPLLPEMFPVSFPGVKTSRDDLVVDIDRERLVDRMNQYFDKKKSHEEMRRISPCALTSTARFEAESVRDHLLERGPLQKNFIRYCYRPFDVRWLYWEPETKLLDEKRSEYFPHVFEGNVWLVSQQKPRREWSRPQFIRSIGCLDLMDRGASCIPLYLKPTTETKPLLAPHQGRDPRILANGTRFNISDSLVNYFSYVGTIDDALEVFYHTLAILHAPDYRKENEGALRQDWPRIPLPDNKEDLLASAALGRQIAALLDTETDVGAVREPPLRTIATFVLESGMTLNESEHFAVTAGWGHAGQGGVTMPGRGKLIERDYHPSEREALVGPSGARPGAEGTSALPPGELRLPLLG
ncbi:MAG: type ISP restriction/modification enzyme [Terriglobia bacterium]